MPGPPEPPTTPPAPPDLPGAPGNAFATASALSRFEFETGRGNEGTKILMVEWDTLAHGLDGGGSELPRPGRQACRRPDDSHGASVWWEGKPASVLAVRDADPELDTSGRTRRLLYLLPHNAPVPSLVTIACPCDPGPTHDHATKPGQQLTIMTAKPMPAIFPAALTSDAAAGRRGVLHMLWARKRLAALQSEIDAEMRENGESVGLEMALQERQWIQDHFALATCGPPSPDSPLQQQNQGRPVPAPNKAKSPSDDPTSPKSLGKPPQGDNDEKAAMGNRLGEKLRGLKLATGPADLAAGVPAVSGTAAKPQSLVTILTPDTSGVTVPASLQVFGGPIPTKEASLDAIVAGAGPPPASHGGGGGSSSSNDEEDLFCLPLSPRSPGMDRSPFSLL